MRIPWGSYVENIGFKQSAEWHECLNSDIARVLSRVTVLFIAIILLLAGQTVYTVLFSWYFFDFLVGNDLDDALNQAYN